MVINVLQNDYFPGVDLTSYIEAAASMVDQIVHRRSPIGKRIDNYQAEIVERWLSAHFYCMMDKAYSNKSTAGASATYQGQTKNFLEATYYGQMALRLDPTGILETIGRDERRVARCNWLGRRSNYNRLNGYLGDGPALSGNPNLPPNNDPPQE